MNTRAPLMNVKTMKLYIEYSGFFRRIADSPSELPPLAFLKV